MRQIGPVSVPAPGALHLQVLGRFALWREGAPIELGSGGRRLLALLALNGARASRSWVAGQLWSDNDERHAGASLRTALHRLPRPDDTPLVSADRDEVWLNEALNLDLHAATCLARLLEDWGSGTGPDVGLGQMDLLAHDVLPDWYDAWADDARERHRQRRLHALERMCGRLRLQGRYGASIEAGLVCIAADPLRESAHRVLIETHLAQNNLGEAIRQYQACHRALTTGLGVTPSHQLRVLAHGPQRALPRGVTA